jgi:Domain of unknown function (DUF6532)
MLTHKLPLLILLQADQRVNEWRNALGNTALTLIQTFFANNGMATDEARREYAAYTLNGFKFLFSEVLETDGKVRHGPLFFSRWNDSQQCQLKRKGIFNGPLVIQTFAAHFRMTSSAEVVPELGNFRIPFCALALAATAVRVFLVYRLLLKNVMLAGRTRIYGLARWPDYHSERCDATRQDCLKRVPPYCEQYYRPRINEVI